MQRLGISKEEVPTNVHIINMPISERYKIGVFIASSLGVILLLALIGYLFYLYWREARRRKAVLANLKQEKEHLSLALEGGIYSLGNYSLVPSGLTTSSLAM